MEGLKITSLSAGVFTSLVCLAFCFQTQEAQAAQTFTLRKLEIKSASMKENSMDRYDRKRRKKKAKRHNNHLCPAYVR